MAVAAVDSRESNGTYPIEHYLHENKCKLIALSVYGEKCVKMLICEESRNSGVAVQRGIHDANEAFVAVLQSSSAVNGNVSDWKNIVKTLKHNDNKNIFFIKSHPNKWEINSLLDIESLDMSLVIELLLKIPEFTSYKRPSQNFLACNSCRIQNACCMRCKSCERCKSSRRIRCKSNTLPGILGNLQELRNSAFHAKNHELIAVDNAKPTGRKYLEFVDKLRNYVNFIKCLLLILEERSTITADKNKEMLRQLESVLEDTKFIYFNRISKEVKFDSLRFTAYFHCTSRNPILKKLENDESQAYKILFNTIPIVVNDYIETKILKNKGDGYFDVSCCGWVNPPTGVVSSVGFNITFRIIGETENSIPGYLRNAGSDEVTEFKHKMAEFVQRDASKVLRTEVECTCIGYVLGSIEITFQITPLKDKWNSFNVEKYSKMLGEAINIDFYTEILNKWLHKVKVNTATEVPTNDLKIKMSVSTFDENLLEFLENEKQALKEISEKFLNDGVYSIKKIDEGNFDKKLLRKLLRLQIDENTLIRTFFFLGKSFLKSKKDFLGLKEVICFTTSDPYRGFLCESIAKETYPATENYIYTNQLNKIFQQILSVVQKKEIVSANLFDELPFLKQIWEIATPEQRLTLLTKFFLAMYFAIKKKYHYSVQSFLKAEGLADIENWWEGKTSGNEVARTVAIAVISVMGIAVGTAVGIGAVSGSFFGPVGFAVGASVAGAGAFGLLYILQRQARNELYNKIFVKKPDQALLDDAFKFYDLNRGADALQFDEKYLQIRLMSCVGLEPSKDFKFYTAYRNILEVNKVSKYGQRN